MGYVLRLQSVQGVAGWRSGNRNDMEEIEMYLIEKINIKINILEWIFIFWDIFLKIIYIVFLFLKYYFIIILDYCFLWWKLKSKNW